MTHKAPLVFDEEHVAEFRDYLIGSFYCDWAESNTFPLMLKPEYTEKQLREAIIERDKLLERFSKYNADIIIAKLRNWLESHK